MKERMKERRYMLSFWHPVTDYLTAMKERMNGEKKTE